MASARISLPLGPTATVGSKTIRSTVSLQCGHIPVAIQTPPIVRRLFLNCDLRHRQGFCQSSKQSLAPGYPFVEPRRVVNARRGCIPRIKAAGVDGAARIL